MNGKLETPDYVKAIRAGNFSNYDDAIKSILNNCKIATPPVDVYEIAKRLNFTLFSANFVEPQMSGIMADSKEKLAKFDSQRFIAFNEKDYETRRRFTIAHELAHFVLHCCENDDFYERYRTEGESAFYTRRRLELEHEADKFAAALLMPKEMFFEYIRESPYKNNTEILTQKICEKFNVSPKAVELRYQELSIKN